MPEFGPRVLSVLTNLSFAKLVQSECVTDLVLPLVEHRLKGSDGTRDRRSQGGQRVDE